MIHDWVQALGSQDLGFYRWVVEQGGGVLKGDHMLNGFILIKPENEIAKQIQLMNHINDADHLERHRHFETWFKHVQDIPGTFYLWIVEHLFMDNGLVNGTLEIERRARRPRAGSSARCSCSAARATTSRRRRRCSPRPTTSAPRPPTSRST